MRRMLAVLVAFLALLAPARLCAKGKTVKIMIKGSDIKTIEITEQKVLSDFSVWTGPGTSSNVPGSNPNTPGLIVDWSQGSVAKAPKGFRQYEVSFYARDPNERLI
jgi:hypothetical protein